MDISQIAELLISIQKRYPKFEVEATTADIWARELKHFSYEAGLAAVDEHFRNSRFAPAFSDIRALIYKFGGKKSDEYPFPEETRRAMRQARIQAGIVPCWREGKMLGWFPEEYAQSIGTERWSLKIDLVIERMGATWTMRELKRRLNLTTAKAAISQGPDFARRYKAVLAELLRESETKEIEDIFA